MEKLIVMKIRNTGLPVLDMKSTTCYYLDSLRPIDINSELRQIIDVAMALYMAKTGFNMRVKVNWVNSRLVSKLGDSVDIAQMCHVPKKKLADHEVFEEEQNNLLQRHKMGVDRVLLSAGTDTSSGTMEWMLSLLLNNPQVLKQAQAEIEDCVGKDRLINESDISNLPYLRCIVNETMRLYPPGPLVFHESSKDCTVGGYNIPSGTMLLMNLWAMQNDKNWEDPKKFKPDRFRGLQGSRDGFKLMPFGSGRRSCPTENLAMRMVGLAL
ncbi:cytochrome P450 81C13-like, partial [Bidens hawaiensis]|uniref:cytochrome P450 81C13-like n=1 Tax=Bidens hawaiensis TaxID=980011 RepID=UPI004049232D